MKLLLPLLATPSLMVSATLDISATMETTPSVRRVDSYTDRDAASTPGNVGLAFSGGGSRALTCAWGQLRALNALGLLSQTKALSSVSGGSWATVLFTYLPTSYDDDTFLGTLVTDELDKLVLTKTFGDEDDALTLDYMSEQAMGYVPTQDGMEFVDLLTHMFTTLKSDGVPDERLWTHAIGEYVLGPFGLSAWDSTSELPTHYFCPDEATCEAISDANPGYGGLYNQVRTEDTTITRPFHIINTAMFVKTGQQVATGDNADYWYEVPVQATPYFTGIMSQPDAYYKDASGDYVKVGGGGVASHAFNSVLTSLDNTNDSVNVAQSGPFSLTDITGASSAAYAEVVQNDPGDLPSEITDLLNDLDIDTLDPAYSYWPVADASMDTPGTTVNFADAGTLDNSGVASLLTYTDIDSIVAFVQAEDTLTMGSDGIVEMDSMITALFGYQPYDSDNGYVLYPDTDASISDPVASSIYRFNQVFDSSRMDEVSAGLWASYQSGAMATYLQTGLEVQQNDWWGIEGNNGRTVDVFWVYLTKSDNFESQLGDSVKLYLDTVDDSFPNYSTEDTHLSATEVNLLAHQTAYNLMQNADTLQSLYTSSSSPSSSPSAASDDALGQDTDNSDGDNTEDSAGGSMAWVVIAAIVVFLALVAVGVAVAQNRRARGLKRNGNDQYVEMA